MSRFVLTDILNGNNDNTIQQPSPVTPRPAPPVPPPSPRPTLPSIADLPPPTLHPGFTPAEEHDFNKVPGSDYSKT